MACERERETPPCEHTRVFVCAECRDICKEIWNAALFFCVSVCVCASSLASVGVAVYLLVFPRQEKKNHRLTHRGFQLSQKQLLSASADGTNCSEK